MQLLGIRTQIFQTCHSGVNQKVRWAGCSRVIKPWRSKHSLRLPFSCLQLAAYECEPINVISRSNTRDYVLYKPLFFTTLHEITGSVTQFEIREEQLLVLVKVERGFIKVEWKIGLWLSKTPALSLKKLDQISDKRKDDVDWDLSADLMFLSY